MSLSLDPTVILEQWVDEYEAPLESDKRFLGLIKRVEIFLVKTIPGIEESYNSDADYAFLVNFESSLALQRAWENDFKPFASESEGVGGFSKSYSRNKSSKYLYFTDDQLETLKDGVDSDAGVHVIKSFSFNPNFNPYSSRRGGNYGRYFT